MNYKKLLDLYKQGQLSEADAEKVRSDIQRQEAIADYLYESEELFDREFPETLPQEQASDFAKTIQKSIRKAFLKLGVAVLILAVLSALLIQFALPKIVSHFYYNPGEIVETSSDADPVNRLERDLSVYTELALPGYRRDRADVSAHGYGNYDINIRQGISLTNYFTDISGKIEKGKITLYNNNILREPSYNTFDWFSAAGDDDIDIETNKSLSHLAGKEAASLAKKYSKETVSRMTRQDKYIAFVTLDRQMPYEAFIAWIDELNPDGEIWCAPRISGLLKQNNLGFVYNPFFSSNMNEENEKYPNLTLWKRAFSEKDIKKLAADMKKESFMKEHFISMLHYMHDQKDFSQALENAALQSSGRNYAAAADYIEKNGLTIYGFALVVQKEDAEKILKTDNVYAAHFTKLI